MFDGWDALLDKMGEVKDDMTLDDFLYKYYEDEKVQRVLSNR